ncbi:PREDICTED: defensin-like protein 11 [Camelina sativa]|uniref:Defensin-like protein 11 n=1 Tax=Camelina sativa TaxID=90675 RepID=A0ABM1R3Y7_CAMSA|nr:PREDICTED: defensin-like protein 11 [Camelina sativa]
MRKMINFSAINILVLILLVSTELMEQGEAQAQGCEWECKHLPNFPCWLKDAGERLCHDLCKYEGAIGGFCVSDPHRCLCRKAGCS